MKILYSWLRDFVDVPVGPDELAAALSMRGFALEGLEGAGDEAVLDLEVTANRPDAMSVIGIAREVATMYGLALRLPAPDAAGDLATPALAAGDADVAVTIADAELCPRYAAAVADVRIGPSPAWLVRRLQAAGVRPINNIVDISNYVLVETGHPTHAFDLERLEGRALVIRRAREGEAITTLDGERRILAADMLVIADAARAQAVAGVMGGADSEVHDATRVMALESAWFRPASVRRTSKRLNLKTEASIRFERGADLDAPVRALARVMALVERTGAGRARGTLVDRYPAPDAGRVVRLRLERIARLLGLEVPAGAVTDILGRLGFALAPAASPDGHAWDVRVPSHRVDVHREADLVEEVARHHGFERIPATFPALAAMPPAPDARIERDRLVRRVLAAAGYSEAITFTFVEAGAAAAFAPDADIVPVANPLSEKLAVLRPSLLPGVLESIAHNRRREQADVRLFELGSRFSRSGGEGRAVGFAVAGAAAPPHWSAASRPADFYDVKGAVEKICSAVGVEPEFAASSPPGLVPGRAALVRGRPGGGGESRDLGIVGQLLPALAAGRDITGHDEVFVAEIDLDALDGLARRADARVAPLPRFPSIVRDLSIVVDEALPAGSVRGTIRAVAPATLAGLREFDRYRGKGIPDGSVSLSLRLTFRSPDRTLTDAEVEEAMRVVVEALERRHQARRR